MTASTKLNSAGKLPSRGTDGRRANRGARGNSGGKAGRSGRPKWTPVGASPCPNFDRPQRSSEGLDKSWANARSVIRKATALGIPIDVVGQLLSPPVKSAQTLKKHFAWELEVGRREADLEVTKVAFQMAISGEHERITWSWLERRVAGFQPLPGGVAKSAL